MHTHRALSQKHTSTAAPPPAALCGSTVAACHKLCTAASLMVCKCSARDKSTTAVACSQVLQLMLAHLQLQQPEAACCCLMLLLPIVVNSPVRQLRLLQLQPLPALQHAAPGQAWRSPAADTCHLTSGAAQACAAAAAASFLRPCCQLRTPPPICQACVCTGPNWL